MRDRAVIVFLSFLASALLFAGALASSTEHSFSSLTWRLIILATSGKPVRTTWIHVSLLGGAPLLLILSMICVVLGFRTARKPKAQRQDGWRSSKDHEPNSDYEWF